MGRGSKELIEDARDRRRRTRSQAFCPVSGARTLGGRHHFVVREAGTTVLVVDDDEDMRFLVRLQVELAGDIEVVGEAIDGPEALEVLDRLQAPPVPTVIVLDNRMPGMTGLEVAAKVLERVPGQRIILFSAYLDDATAAEAQRIGIADTVSKSDIAELAAVIRRHAIA